VGLAVKNFLRQIDRADHHRVDRQMRRAVPHYDGVFVDLPVDNYRGRCKVEEEMVITTAFIPAIPLTRYCQSQNRRGRTPFTGAPHGAVRRSNATSGIGRSDEKSSCSSRGSACPQFYGSARHSCGFFR
jgi:hypothetical protein